MGNAAHRPPAPRPDPGFVAAAVIAFLSATALSPDAAGELGPTSTQLNVIADLKLAQGSQQYELDPRMWAGHTSPVRSVVIYNFPARVAYGTASLTEVPRP
ncbi:MAG: hypothetical protein JWO49_1480 [Arthrobacter sp.]|nr:hypothetical protein [Arthrobacter sp.]